MEIKGFITLLKKHKYTLVIIPLVAIIITYFLVRNQPNSYSSQAQISTGIVDQTQQTLGQEVLQESRINQEFANIIQLIRSKKMLDQVSYQIMIHDLTSKTPYRTPSKLMESMNQSAREHAVAVYSNLYKNRQSLSLFDKDQKGMYDLLTSMHYDDQSILKTLTVYRSENSDFVQVEMETDNPELAASIVNTLCGEMIEYFNFLLKDNQRKAVSYLGTLAKAKQDTLTKRMNDLKDYKIKNHVFNLNEQARALYGQIADFETKLDQAKKDAVAFQGAIGNIDKQFDPNDRKYLESAMVRINQSIVNSRAQLQDLNSKYVQSNFNPRYKNSIDSLRRVIESQVNQSSDKYITNPLSNKQNLIQQKLNLQVQQEVAQNSISSMTSQLAALNDRLHTLVPHEAVVQGDESAITVASQEYLDVLQKYNQMSLESNFTARLKQVSMAMPGMAQPSKKMLLVIISGIVSFVFCIAVFFVLFLLDTSLKAPRDLANKTKTPVLGYLNLLNTASIDLNKVWHDRQNTPDVATFRNLLQSIRFEIETEMQDDKVLLVNSITKGEGKTYLSMNLAYAFAAINKQVLLIDGNFINPGITKLINPKIYLEDYLNGKVDASNNESVSNITFMGNRNGSASLLEVASQQVITSKIEALKQVFDVIIIEASALETLNKSKEWITFSDRILTVFEAGQSFKEPQQLNLEYLKSYGNKFIGWVMNMVMPDELVDTAKVK
ncbi:exopolysaccharide transport family protein [Mucilaginibacter agri]|uniref:Lipopolysaccharide biosynthesis protein n=1 Tax=Mucilaginibacter agri TaxID=2695265 RepID=A0A965ZLL9_9SPHI|nr:Wzz/FepE/Etk N-terminal domain-containing protein [Mucilaginibacter agri]NCD72253.1 lipopolysaccharide biosynthesis protein [Mucilaginibacter agri]